MKHGTLLLLLAATAFAACKNSDETVPAENTTAKTVAIPVINYAVNATHPHDTSSYTEGFLFHKGELYESTGYDSSFPSTRSLFGTVDLKTGKIEVKKELDKKKYFGEGIVFLNDKIYQLTYTTKVGFIYDAKSFEKIAEFTYPSEQGWGMTTDGASLIMTDGTNKITYISPADFKVSKTLSVSDENGPVFYLNELEIINGFIYANVFTKNYIVKIDPATGNVVGKLDLSSLVHEVAVKYPAAQQMNGIAYDSASKKVFVTGKLWPVIYEIAFSY